MTVGDTVVGLLVIAAFLLGMIWLQLCKANDWLEFIARQAATIAGAAERKPEGE